MAEQTDSSTVSSIESDEDDIELSQDAIFDLLRNERRRTLLRFLRSEGGQVPITELAMHISSKEQGMSVTRGSKAYKSVYVSLVQTHVPKMQNAGVIAHDEEQGTVRLLPKSELLFTHLDPERDGRTAPAVDVQETPTQLVVSIDLPGFSPAEVSLEVGMKELEIFADRAQETDTDTEFIRQERPANVRRLIDLPVPINLAQIETTFDDGVLTVTLGKAHESREKKRIELE